MRATYVTGKQVIASYYMQRRLRTILFSVVITQQMVAFLFAQAMIRISIYMMSSHDSRRVLWEQTLSRYQDIRIESFV